MLSRIAESLFWIGRYVERADGTARLLDVHLQLLLEDPWVDEDTACRSLLSVIGSDSVFPHQLTRHDLLNILTVDRNEQASIASSLTSARENARRVREIVSTELWECLNTTRSRMPRKVSIERAHDFFGWVRERLRSTKVPQEIRFADHLPYNDTGKLLRRAIQAVCEGRDPGDLTTMDDPAALQQIKDLQA